jgi:hypothetical protein
MVTAVTSADRLGELSEVVDVKYSLGAALHP